jgi:drug/metabolite transporter (DMT)-like permease
MSTNGSADSRSPAPARRSGLLERLTELRMIIAILFGIFGIVCVVWGIGFTTARDLDRAAGINVNLLGGIGMLVFAGLFAAWALLKPLEQEVAADEDASAASTQG